MAEIKEISSIEEFNDAIKSKELTVAKFSATWCNPCNMMGKMIKSMDSIPGVNFIELDVDSDNLDNIVAKYHITHLPTFIFFKESEELGSSVGYIPLDEFNNKINLYK